MNDPAIPDLVAVPKRLPTACTAGRQIYREPGEDGPMDESWAQPCPHPIAAYMILDFEGGGPAELVGICRCHSLELEGRGVAYRMRAP